MRANQLGNLKTAIVDFIRSQHLLRVIVECFSCLNHKFSLFSFENEIRKGGLDNLRDFCRRHHPGYLWLPVGFLSLGMACSPAKVDDEPLYYPRIRISDGDGGREVYPGSIDLSSISDPSGFLFHDAFVTDRNGAFSVNDSSKISKLSSGIFHKLEVYHNNENQVHRERLNPETSKEDAIVCSATIYEIAEGVPKSLPARAQGNKVTARTAATVPLTDGQTPMGDQLSVTDFQAQIQWYGSFVTITDQVQYVVQDRVLNEATKVLSLQLGLTIDTLIRDMMVSTASTILCTNGLNGNTQIGRAHV